MALVDGDVENTGAGPGSEPSVSPTPWSSSRQLAAWLYAERWLIAVFLAALVVRLHWNLVVHPPGDYLTSDMGGYVNRADRLLAAPLEPREYAAFFPFGTHLMVAGLKWIFGGESYPAIGILYAFIGALGIAFAYAVARRASRFAIVAPAVGLFGIVYYPLISLGGYILSEIPFSTCLAGALLFALRMVDHGRKRDAIAMGIFAGIGTVFRPQMLLSAAVVGLFWIVRRKSLPKIRLTHLLLSGLPLAVVLGVSAAHLHHNTGRWGLVSENGNLNLVFGRCHNVKIQSLPDGKGHGAYHFRPPPFLQVAARERRARDRGIPPKIALDPAMGDRIAYRGYIGDRDAHMGYVERCLAITGVRGQLHYTWTNLKLLWLYNVPWPDSASHTWRVPARWWTRQHRTWLAIPALLGLLWIFIPGPRTARLGLVSVNLLAVLLLAAIYFGGTRHRTPYDPVIIILALETYATAAWLLLRLSRQYVKRRVAKRRTGRPQD